ncbi:BTB/POZ domain-containing protein NPY1-like [Actinidia eriantha]|uniref:BTB/POZ domain-containing protein NPY1-like n=1 Tax=Actinidia eriantha TaxID=165200 RepID=UPI002588BB98|nr:BTB/POZ domain-containing protein NPY1-like [Actinidia eriantha]
MAGEERKNVAAESSKAAGRRKLPYSPATMAVGGVVLVATLGYLYVSSEMATDAIVNVAEVKFYLHEFPLLSKSNRLQKLAQKGNEENLDDIHLPNFPGGPKAFEICAKFCYVVSIKLDEASVNDLLIPARSPQTTTKYDTELVQSLVNRFVVREKRRRDVNIAEKNEKIISDSVLGYGSWLNVGKLIDGYLAEIAYDPNLPVSSFILLSQSIPESARPIHDGLYKAIDIYLKENPNLTKSERKKICGLMEVKKLTMDASMHAAQNELLPLRVVVQFLFFEQAKAAAGLQALNDDRRKSSQSDTKTEEDWEKPVPDEGKSLGKQMSQMKMTDLEIPRNGKLIKKGSKTRGSGKQLLLPSRSWKIFDKLWVGKGYGGENRSTETSGSSQSPTSMIQGETKSSGSPSRNTRRPVS